MQALAICPLPAPLVRPNIAPLHLSFQYGAPNPTNAGTTMTPPESSTLLASSSESLACGKNCISSLSHWIKEPETKIEPSRANFTSSPIFQATVESNPSLEMMASSPVLTRMNPPVPYVFLMLDFSKHDSPNSAACWSPTKAEIGQV